MLIKGIKIIEIVIPMEEKQNVDALSKYAFVGMTMAGDALCRDRHSFNHRNKGAYR